MSETERIGWLDGTRVLGLNGITDTTSVTVRCQNPGTVVTASVNKPIKFIRETRRDRRKKR